MFFPAPTTHVGDRFVKSRIIPEQARALANAFKQAVVKPLKKPIFKKKSFDAARTEPQILSSQASVVQSFSSPSSIVIDNSDQPYFETSVDSYESYLPGKSARHNDESASSSSIEMPISPPAKPPRHFSVYKNEDELTFLRQSTNNQLVQIQTSESLKNIETFTVQPICVAVKTNVPLRTELFDYSVSSSSSSSSSPITKPVDTSTDQIIQLATNLANRILKDVKNDLIPTTKPSESIDTPIVSHSTFRPLTFVSCDSKSSTISPILDIVTVKPTPIFTTSVKITRPTTSFISATTKTTVNKNSTNDSNSTSNSNSRLISDRSQLLQTSSQQTSLDSTDPTSYDNTIFLPTNTGHATPTRSSLSDYDNLHGSYGSLNDDNQTTRTITPDLPSSVSSSTTTIYESLDNFPSSSSSATYVTAASTLNTDGRRTPSQRLNSDITDEDLLESFGSDRSSQGTSTKRYYPGMLLTFYLFLSAAYQMAWLKPICFSHCNTSAIHTYHFLARYKLKI